MPADAKLTAHFYLSHFTASPLLARAGLSNVPNSAQTENLRRMAQTLEVVRANLVGAQITVLRGFRRVALERIGVMESASDGRSVDFIAPEFGTPRDICAHLVAHGLVFDRLVAAPDWVQLDIPEFGHEPRRVLQTGVFEHNAPMRYLEGLV